MATNPDYDRLADELTAIGRPILVGFEATGNYHRTLAYRLLSAGFDLRLVSSVALARTRSAPQWLGQERSEDPLAADINDLQELSETHEAISRAKTQTWQTHPVSAALLS
jgi:hypothetical protein